MLEEIRNISYEPLAIGPNSTDDALAKTFVIKNLKEFYHLRNLYRAIPLIISPSEIKISYIGQKIDFFSGIDRNSGQIYEKVIIIGYSLPKHDRYARQIIYNMTSWEETNLIYCSLAREAYETIQVRTNWNMINRSTTKWHFDGFDTFPIEWI